MSEPAHYAERADEGRLAGSDRVRRRTGIVTIVVVVVILSAASVVLAAGLSSPAERSASSIVAELAVLRRPQTAADRQLDLRRTLAAGHPGSRQTIVGRLVRLATTLSNGEKIFVAVVRPARSHRPVDDRLKVVLATRTGEPEASDGGETASGIREALFPNSAGDLTHGTAYYSVVPDGVTRVRWVFPLQRHGRRYPKPLTVDVAVHGNVAAALVARDAGEIPSAATWYGSGGGVVATRSDPGRPVVR